MTKEANKLLAKAINDFPVYTKFKKKDDDFVYIVERKPTMDVYGNISVFVKNRSSCPYLLKNGEWVVEVIDKPKLYEQLIAKYYSAIHQVDLHFSWFLIDNRFRYALFKEPMFKSAIRCAIEECKSLLNVKPTQDLKDALEILERNS